MSSAETVHAALLRCVEQKRAGLRLVRTTAEAVTAQSYGHTGRFGWLPPRLIDDRGQPSWALVYSPEIVAAQVEGFPGDLLNSYITGINVFAHGMMTFMKEHGCDPQEAERLTEETLLETSPALLSAITHAQMRILDRQATH